MQCLPRKIREGERPLIGIKTTWMLALDNMHASNSLGSCPSRGYIRDGMSYWLPRIICTAITVAVLWAIHYGALSLGEAFGLWSMAAVLFAGLMLGALFDIRNYKKRLEAVESENEYLKQMLVVAAADIDAQRGPGNRPDTA